MIPDIRNYDDLYRGFRWQIPARYNIGVDVSDKWARIAPERPAILEVVGDREPQVLTFGALSERSNRFANALAARGVRRGDRVAILLPQSRRVPIAHCAVYKLGAIAIPLANLFGADALEYRLASAGVKALVTDPAGLAKIAGLRAQLPALETIFVAGGAVGDALDFDQAIADSSPEFSAADTAPDDPAMMIFTSGTTGNPKGALHGHRVLLGHLPGVQMPHEFFPQPGDRMWTPADWAWAGGLLNVLLPSLHFGLPVVAQASAKFDPEAAFDLMARMGVRNTFIPPTALRMLRTVERPRARFKFALRTLGSGGEQLGAETYEWGKRELGLTINEFYGQTECNLVLGSCAALGVTRAGAIGKPIPGHRVGVIRADGSLCEPDELGQIAVLRPDPVMFIEYWNNPQATKEKFIASQAGDWMTTGDQGSVDKDGYVHFTGRDDDVITSSGYRIGPGEIEDCLLRHPAVALAAVVGKKDPVRTEIVKAFIVLRQGRAASDSLVSELQDFVRTRLSAHEYPREIAFVSSLPLTTTGKIIRRLLRE
ncbi:MAG: acyl-CoA synthetase [Hyphomicrobiales bacterium]|nr:acyl-CoA synthetase [Hyphomicrobiales bacterium]